MMRVGKRWVWGTEWWRCAMGRVRPIQVKQQGVVSYGVIYSARTFASIMLR